MVPVEIQVGEDRFWVGLVSSRGVERDPPPVPAIEPRRLRKDYHVRCQAFTRLLTRGQSKLVLLYLQEHRFSEIPKGWLASDRRVVEEAEKYFSPRRASRSAGGGSGGEAEEG